MFSKDFYKELFKFENIYILVSGGWESSISTIEICEYKKKKKYYTIIQDLF